MRGRDLASSLNQRAVDIKEKLRVVQSSAITLVDADGDNDALSNEIDPCPLDPRPSCPNPAGEVTGCACRVTDSISSSPAGSSPFVWLALGATLYGARRRTRPRR